MTFLPFSKPSITDDEVNAVTQVLKSGWITTGEQCKRLEDNICELVSAPYAIAVSSATAGMHVTLHALGIGPGDEVITPSLTWVSTVNIITLLGAKPVFVDVNKDTLMIEANAVQEKITKNTKAIIPVHYAGAPCDLSALKDLCGQHNLYLIEDAAHAIGTSYSGKLIGFDSTAIFSLHAIKNITSAEGGVVVTNDEKLAENIAQLKFHGLGVDAYDRKINQRNPQAEVLQPGFKYNLPDMNAVLAVVQLSRLKQINQQRADLANYYLELLADIPGILPLKSPEYEHVHAWHLFIVRIDEQITGINRDQFMSLLNKKEIGTGIHFRAIHAQKYYRETLNIADLELPNTVYNSNRICTLPLFPDMGMADVERVVNAIKTILKEV